MGLFISTIAQDLPMTSSAAYVCFLKRKKVKRFRLPIKEWTLTPAKFQCIIRFYSHSSGFKITLQTVNAVLNTWLEYMYDQISQLSTWPHRDRILETMPEDFEQDFPNTFAILDLIELRCEESDIVDPVTVTPVNTLKSLIACDPRGVVMYVSDLFPGSWSGQEIFHNCDLEKMLRGCIQCG